MGNYSKDRMRLIAQGITGGKIWYYDDTGAMSTVADTAGFFQDAGDMGVDTGDLVFMQASGATNDKRVQAASFAAGTQDTGATQGNVGPSTLIGDTG